MSFWSENSVSQQNQISTPSSKLKNLDFENQYCSLLQEIKEKYNVHIHHLMG